VGQEARRDAAAVLVDHLLVGVDEATSGRACSTRRLAAQLVRAPRVVGVEDGDEVARALLDPAGGGGDQPCVALTYDAHAVRVPCQDVRRRVGRAVVDDDDLQPVGRVLLRERAVDRLGDEPLVVVRADDDTHEGHGDDMAMWSAWDRGPWIDESASGPAGGRRARAPRRHPRPLRAEAQAELLMRCLVSLWRTAPDVQVLVVDAASPAAELAAQLRSSVPRSAPTSSATTRR
jgi:hypothetical protein